MADRRRKRRRRRRAQRRAVFGAALIVMFALLVILCVQIFLRSYIGKFDSHRIIQGVSIGNTDVSGLTVKKAKEKVEAEDGFHEREAGSYAGGRQTFRGGAVGYGDYRKRSGRHSAGGT